MRNTEIGRLIQTVEQTGQMHNTLIFYIVGDNGTSAEGGMNGLFNEMTYFNGVQETVESILKHYDELGGPLSIPTWPPVGPWRAIPRSPGRSRSPRTSAVPATAWSSTGPNASRRRAGCPQFHHVIDIAPTVLEAAGLPEPKIVNGTKQAPIEGVSMVYTFGDARAKSRHQVQYFEILGNRGIYADGWFAGTIHRAPWEFKPRSFLSEDKWELYNTKEDFSLVSDLAPKNPAKLKELQALFLKEAVKYHVLPIDDRVLEP